MANTWVYHALHPFCTNNIFSSFHCIDHYCSLLLLYQHNIDFLITSLRRPTTLHDRLRDSDDDDYQDRDYDVAALANNLSQAFRYGIYNNEELDEVFFIP